MTDRAIAYSGKAIKKDVKKTIVAFCPPMGWVQETIENAGSNIGSVWFKKRSNGELRKMTYKLYVKNPSTAKQPKGLSKKDNSYSFPSATTTSSDGIKTLQWNHRKDIDKAHNQMTVLDTNAVVRDENNNIKGRGAWKTISLEGVERIVNKGTEYIIKQY